MHLLVVFLGELKVLLGRNLKIKHVLALLFLLFELFEHDLSIVPLSLQLVLQLHLHLSLGLCLNGFLDCLSDTFFRDLELELHVLFVSDALLSQNVLDLRVAHISLILEILDTRGLNGDINLDKTRLLASFHGLLLRLLGILRLRLGKAQLHSDPEGPSM